MDVLLTYGSDRLAMELKVWRDGDSDPLREGLEQLESYLSGSGLETGWSVIFDQRSGLPPISERTTTETSTTPSGCTVDCPAHAPAVQSDLRQALWNRTAPVDFGARP
jgi:hypothetical protein